MPFTSAYETPPVFYDGQPLAAPALELLRRDVMIADAASRRGASVFYCSAPPRGTTLWTRDQPMRIWWGSFMFRTGMTTAQFTIDILPVGPSQTVHVLFDGVSVWSSAVSTTTVFTPSIDLTGRGYADRRIVEVEVRVVFSSDPSGTPQPGRYIVRMARVGPTSGYMSGRPWPNPLLFGNITEGALNNLSTAVEWLVDQTNVAYQPLWQAARYANSNAGAPQTWTRTWASVYSAGTARNLRADFYMFCNNPAERAFITANDTQVGTSPTYSASNNQQYWSADVDLSGYSGRVDLAVGGQIAAGGIASRWSLPELWMDAADSTLSTPPPAFDTIPSNLGALQARLNSLVDITNQSYSRIVGAADVFDWIPMFARRPVPRSGTDQSSSTDRGVESADAGWKDFYHAAATRRGAILWVYGRGIKINYGPVTIKDTTTRPQWTYEWLYNTELIGGQEVALKKIYFDGLKGLRYGMRFFLTGADLRFAAQELRS
ncbi:MAG TPA: hypothetical protein VFS21_29895 [Roseiflexaceae bacterium]|nr:hypothetical protein [Roseiflexaceae bacterium]